MDSETIERLNAINRRFYEVTAHEFDQTRGQPWSGWDRLLKHLHPTLTVLDVGCGNGRFGVYLQQHLGIVDYTGLDNNPTLLDLAGAAIPDGQFEQRDIVADPPERGAYDLVALFGVLHHLPGAERRQQLVQSFAQRLNPGGMLVFTAWRFYESERLRQRIVPWPADLHVEQHDYLLDWRRGEVALRYCHYVDDAEQAALEAATGLTLLDRYRADGRTSTDNQYSVLQRPTE